MGNKDLAEKNLLQYKDVFSDIVNVNLFGGRHYISANELSREPGELITKSSSDNKLKQLQMDVPMKCNKKYNTRFFVCLETRAISITLCPSATWDINMQNIWSRSGQSKRQIDSSTLIYLLLPMGFLILKSWIRLLRLF